MKKKIFLVSLMVMLLVCLFALSVSAAEPDTSKESVTLKDGETVLSIWDTEDNGLIWYINSENKYAYIAANAPEVDYAGNSTSGTIYGETICELGTIKITVDGVTYGKDKIVVANLSKGIVITSGSNVGSTANCIKGTFDSSVVQYVYLPSNLVSLQEKAFYKATSLKYVNLEDLTSLKKIGGYVFNGCSSFGGVLDLTDLPIVEIGGYLTGSTAVTQVNLPDTLQTLGDAAFQSSKSLVTINFPSTIQSLSKTNYTFDGCTALETVTGLGDFIAAGKLKLGTQAFCNCPKLYNVEGLITNGVLVVPEGITSIGTQAFCKNYLITSATLPSTLTSLSDQVFNNCTALETINGFGSFIAAGKLKLNTSMFTNCKKLYNIEGLMTNGILIIPEGITSIGTFAFSECDRIRYVELPSTITTVGQGAFAFCDSIVLVSFDKVDAKIKNAIANGETYTAVTFDNCGTFKGCKSLVAMSVPEGTTKIINRFVGQGCTSLTAFYMPDTVTFMGTNGGGQGPFCDAAKFYFVNESFTVGQCLVNGEIDLTKLVLPAKPTVYYMPTNLTEFGGHIESNASSKNGTIFRGCTSINDVLVFSENFTNYNGNSAFSGMGTASAPKTVVFLADMQSYVTSKGAAYISFVFANKADKSPADIGITCIYENSSNTESYMYFCYDDGKYYYSVATSKDAIRDASAIAEAIAGMIANKTTEAKHVQKPDTPTSQGANCTEPAMLFKTCFCETKFDRTVDEANPALGHIYNFNAITSIVYADYTKDGVFTCACDREECEGVKAEVIEGTALFEYLGMAQDMNSTRITVGYFVNEKYVDLFNANGGALTYGVVAYVPVDENDLTPLTVSEGAATPVDKDYTIFAEVDNEENQYASFDFIVSGFPMGDTALIMCAFACDGNNVVYLGNTQSETASIITVSF